MKIIAFGLIIIGVFIVLTAWVASRPRTQRQLLVDALDGR